MSADFSSPYALYGNATTYHDSPTTESQGGLLDSMFPSSSHAYIKNDVDSVIEFLNIRRQRANDIAEATNDRRQSMMATPSVPNAGAFLPFTEPGFGGSGLDAFQYHLSQGGMDILHYAHALGPPVSMSETGQRQALAALSHNMRTSMTETGDRSFLCGEVARHHNKRTKFTPAHATSPPSTNLDYGHRSEVRFGSTRSCLPGQSLSSAARTYTSDNGDDHTRSSPPRIEIEGPIVMSFVSGGIKNYRCKCGYESSRKRDVDRHLESLQHSERKYECSCGKKFTRYDSLHRHRKERCINRWVSQLKWPSEK